MKFYDIEKIQSMEELLAAEDSLKKASQSAKKTLGLESLPSEIKVRTKNLICSIEGFIAEIKNRRQELLSSNNPTTAVLLDNIYG